MYRAGVGGRGEAQVSLTERVAFHIRYLRMSLSEVWAFGIQRAQEIKKLSPCVYMSLPPVVQVCLATQKSSSAFFVPCIPEAVSVEPCLYPKLGRGLWASRIPRKGNTWIRELGEGKEAPPSSLHFETRRSVVRVRGSQHSQAFLVSPALLASCYLPILCDGYYFYPDSSPKETKSCRQGWLACLRPHRQSPQPRWWWKPLEPYPLGSTASSAPYAAQGPACGALLCDFLVVWHLISGLPPLGFTWVIFKRWITGSSAEGCCGQK